MPRIDSNTENTPFFHFLSEILQKKPPPKAENLKNDFWLMIFFVNFRGRWRWFERPWWSKFRGLRTPLQNRVPFSFFFFCWNLAKLRALSLYFHLLYELNRESGNNREARVILKKESLIIEIDNSEKDGSNAQTPQNMTPTRRPLPRPGTVTYYFAWFLFFFIWYVNFWDKQSE